MRYFHSWNYRVHKLTEAELRMTPNNPKSSCWEILWYDRSNEQWRRFNPILTFSTGKRAKEVATVLETEPVISEAVRFERLQQIVEPLEALLWKAHQLDQKIRNELKPASDYGVAFMWRPHYCVTCARLLPFPATLCDYGHWVQRINETNTEDALKSLTYATRRWLDARQEASRGDSAKLFSTLGELNFNQHIVPGYVAGILV